MATAIKPSVKPKPRLTKAAKDGVDGSSSFDNQKVIQSSSSSSTRDNHRQANESLINVDAKGHVLSFDVREDEEQSEKYREIIDLLVAAGYFRARMKGLSPFDKVVGGLTWAIEMTGQFDVDVNLVFHENLTIGQKISLTEKIVRVLQKMSCPHRLEPHQMSLQEGLMDFIHIFPVIQWLVKKSIESRSASSQMIKDFALRLFDGHFKDMPTTAKDVRQVERLLCRNPRRMFRYPNKNSIQDERINIRTTILEYSGCNLVDIVESFPQALTSSSAPASSTGKEENEGEKMERLFVDDDDGDDIERDHIFQTRLTDQLLASRGITKRVVTIIQEEKEEVQLADIISTLNDLRERETKMTERLNFAQEEVDRLKNQQNEIIQTIEMRRETEQESNERRKLVKSLDQLKKDKIAYKKSCRIEKATLEEDISRLEAMDDATKSDADDEEERLKAEVESQSKKLKKMTLHVSKLSQELMRVQRRLDDIPSRSEVTQYQRRFVELYDQISGRHVEAKKFFVLYNQHDDTRTQLDKEFNLLSSIMDSFVLAKESPSLREQFVTQFETIIANLTLTRQRLESRLSNERHRKDILSRQVQDLLEKGRLYTKIVDKFKKEVTKNQVILATKNQDN